MSKNNLISLHCFGKETGKIGFDENRNVSFFQYNPDFLKENIYPNMFPLVIKRAAPTQVFDKYNNDTFRGLPPMIADSLPDAFGNIIFKAWLENNNKDFSKISVLEQLAYVGKRGMGALEYLPSKDIPANTTINIDEITAIVKQVLENKNNTGAPALDHASLLHIFKIGTSAGGARPKILVSENKATGAIIPGDLIFSADYDHYLIKLGIDESADYSRETIEYIYYLTATAAGITMMPSKLIERKHFATLRFDRQDGKKKHALTATGLTGWDFNDPKVSSYENLFDLAIRIKVPHKDVEQLFLRMVFNLVFANNDDHLKNHSFIYDEVTDRWGLAPAYDLTYSLNPLLTYTRTSRVLSVNGKRVDIALVDVLKIADSYTIKNPKGIVERVTMAIDTWLARAKELSVPQRIIEGIMGQFVRF